MIHEYWPEFLQLPSKGPRARPFLGGRIVYGTPYEAGGEYTLPGPPIEAALDFAAPAPVVEAFPSRIADRQMLPKRRYWLAGLGQDMPSLFDPVVSVPVGSGAPELGPETLPFDETLPWPGVGDNRGCFPGYFAQRVAPGELDSSQPASIGIVQGGSVAVRCRRMEGYTAAINAEETGQRAAENWYQTTKSVGDFFGNVGLNIGTGLHTLASYAIVGAALYFFILREQGKR